MTYPKSQSKLMSQAGLHSRFLTTGWCLFSLITVPSISPTNLPSRHLFLLMSSTSRVTKVGNYQVLILFNPHKSAGGRYYCPHFIDEETDAENPVTQLVSREQDSRAHVSLTRTGWDFNHNAIVHFTCKYPGFLHSYHYFH